MSSNTRDSQFKNFARLLLDELCEASIIDITTPFNDNWREEWEGIIARRAYDLVAHAIRVGCSDHVLWALPRVPDVLELPEDLWGK